MSASNNSSSQNQLKNKDQSSTKGNSKSLSAGQKKVTFLNSTIFDKSTVLNQKNKNALEAIFDRLKVQTIGNSLSHIEIIVHQKDQDSKARKANEDLFLDSQSQEAKQYDYMNARLTKQYEQFKAKIVHCPYQYSYNNYLEWLKEMQHKYFISWFMPIRQHSTEIKSISISHKTLTLMGYTAQEAALALFQYKTNCLNFLNNEAFQQLYWTYTNFFSKFMDCDLQGNISRTDVIQQSQNIIVNELIGKNQRRIKTEMKIWMPSPFIVCMEILTIAKGQKIYSQSLQLSRKQIQQMYNNNLANELSHVLKFPKPRMQQKKLAMCSYVVIDNFLE